MEIVVPRRRAVSCWLVAALAAGLAVGASARPAAAATITVTSLADNTVTDGLVTLREAIMAANTDAAVDGSNAGSGADEIVFATGPGAITLNGTQLPVIIGTLTITGPGAAQLAMDGAQQSRILEVGPSAALTVRGLTIRNGRTSSDGAGILNQSILTVMRCTFTGNAAVGDGGGIWSGGTLTVQDSTFTANSALNGAGIGGLGPTQVWRSTFSNNYTGGIAPFAGGGGGALIQGTASIQYSTFANNSAGNGGAIVNTTGGALTVSNSTLRLNQAVNFGGAISNAGFAALTVDSCTITANRADTNDDGLGSGGGVNITNGSVLIRNTIVANNRASGGGLSDVSGTVQAGSSYNVLGVDTGLTGMSNGANGNQIGTASTPLNALLVSLQDNGGPTETQALRAGSPALDRGAPAGLCPLDDQRGVMRPLDADHDGTAVCDVGAFEAFVIDSGPVSFYTLSPPCRVADTRQPAAPGGGPALQSGTTRFFPVASVCNVPADAAAVAANLTVVGASEQGHLEVYPAGAAMPASSVINFTAGITRANNAVVSLGAGGQVAVRCTTVSPAGTTDFVFDVTGYFK